MTARILIIEDHPANMELMRYLLEVFGHIVMPANDGHLGCELASQTVPDLIICDIHLPKLDGFGVVKVLKDDPATGKVPVIAVTAQAMVGDRDRLLGAGFDGYICKPIEPECFVSQVDAFLPPALRSRNAVDASAASPAAKVTGARRKTGGRDNGRDNVSDNVSDTSNQDNLASAAPETGRLARN